MRVTHKNITSRKKKTFKKRKSKKTLKKRKPKKTVKQTLKNTKIIKGGETNDECSICFEELNNPVNPDITLSCKHTFHRICMITTCTKSHANCSCPLCRKELIPQDLNDLGIPSPPPPLQPLPPLPELPYLNDINEFGEYINNKLRAPTRNALEKLEHELNEFLGTDKLPLEIFDGVMEFELQLIGGLYRYRFIRILQTSEVPIIPAVNNKYFRYISYQNAIDQNLIEPDEYDFLVPDDYPIYAYHVYDIF